jgi:aryl sulfotransferase
VLLVHYRDLVEDLEGEMGRVADHLRIDVPHDLWADVVARCRFDAFKATFVEAGAMDGAFEGGANAFFRIGAGRRGSEELDAGIRDRCAELLVAEQLDADATRWLACGALESGIRP